ncbi:Ankyrin repeat-containing protein [Glarea lozoyensis ATCC 20868]|uniref:Ankyrin repeat-containing protein n=1 Tax=Glarea lozoyensis (strain ATCC 20868 / MF5171) TaxID=1116229 RepID=S3DFE7_GLAL2|nr:Ankyrin repeat-containing protein [Glarea lozoyensis ATCC 20868]EPE37142.1 Ankyrin repeat-containing protein [Glarea lozoyensis ATCC 20868]
MDPVTAVGLAGSVVQLGVFALGTVKALKQISDSVRNGLRDLENLETNVNLHQTTLDLLLDTASKTRTDSPAEVSLLEQFMEHAIQFKKSLQEFSLLIQKTNTTTLKGKKRSRAEKAVKLLLRNEEIQKYSSILNDQICTVGVLLTQLSAIDCNASFRETQQVIRNEVQDLVPQISSIKNSIQLSTMETGKSIQDAQNLISNRIQTLPPQIAAIQDSIHSSENRIADSLHDTRIVIDKGVARYSTQITSLEDLIRLSKVETNYSLLETQLTVRDGFQGLQPQFSASQQAMERYLLETQSKVQQEIQSLSPEILSIQDSILLLKRQLKSNGRISDPFSQTPGGRFHFSKMRPTKGQSTGSYWYSQYKTVLGRLNTCAYSYQQPRTKLDHDKKWPTEGYFEFSFIPNKLISSYILTVNISWAHSNGSHIHIGLKPTCRRLCTDESVLNLFGIHRRRYKEKDPCRWNSTIHFGHYCPCGNQECPRPDVRAVEELLDTGIVSANDVCYLDFESLGNSLLERTVQCFSTQYTKEFHGVCRLLLMHGAQVMQQDFLQIERHRWSLINHVELLPNDLKLKSELTNWDVYSIRKLLITADPQPSRHHYGSYVRCAKTNRDLLLENTCHLEPLLPLDNGVELIQNEYADIIDIFDSENRLDRWLLIVFSYHDPEYTKVLKRMADNWLAVPTRYNFRLENVKNEIFKEYLESPTDNRIVEKFYRVLFAYGTLPMWKYFTTGDNIVPVELFEKVISDNISFVRDHDTFLDVVFGNDVVSIELFRELVHDDRFWTTVSTRNNWEKFRLRLPVPNDHELGNSSIYLRDATEVWLSSPISGFVAEKRMLVDELVRLRHGALLDGTALGFEILCLTTLRLRPSRYIDEYIRRDYAQDLRRLLAYPNAGLEAKANRKFSDEYSSTILELPEGYTPLMSAVQGGMLDFTQLLVHAGADIRGHSSRYFSALHIARHNCLGTHPRELELHWPDEFTYISLETDLQILTILEGGLKNRGEIEEPELIEEHEEEPCHFPKKIRDPLRRQFNYILQRLYTILAWLSQPTITFRPELKTTLLKHTITSLVFIASLVFVTGKQMYHSFRPHSIIAFSTSPIVVIFLAIQFTLFLKPTNPCIHNPKSALTSLDPTSLVLTSILSTFSTVPILTRPDLTCLNINLLNLLNLLHRGFSIKYPTDITTSRRQINNSIGHGVGCLSGRSTHDQQLNTMESVVLRDEALMLNRSTQ